MATEMRRFPTMQLGRTPLLLAALVLGVLPSTVCVAQLAGSIDLTQIERRSELRRPPARDSDPSGRRGTVLTNDACATIPHDAPSLRTTLIWLDRDQYSEVDRPKFEARILNTGSVPFKIPFSPHQGDLQPADPAAKFSFWEMFVSLNVIVTARNVEWRILGGGAALYGSDSHPGSMLTLQPGEWVQIIAEAEPMSFPLSNLPPLAHSADAITHMNADTDIHQSDMLLTSTEAATVQHPLCVRQTEGPNVVVKLKWN